METQGKGSDLVSQWKRKAVSHLVQPLDRLAEPAEPDQRDGRAVMAPDRLAVPEGQWQGSEKPRKGSAKAVENQGNGSAALQLDRAIVARQRLLPLPGRLVRLRLSEGNAALGRRLEVAAAVGQPCGGLIEPRSEAIRATMLEDSPYLLHGQ